jgi:ABC-2 type transport system ATP-binding protein
MLEVHELTKRYGDTIAVDHISFTVEPGVITGFLGPNGAGKSTTMRMILGLDRPTSGKALVAGRSYAESKAPLAELGALLEAKAVDKGRSARNHLLALGATVGIGASRVDELLEVVGLADVARKPAGAFSLGMGQRLGIASALLADPQVVMLDEPVNGLDPDGILWIRTLLRELAAEGRTVFLSSHLMSEMELTAEHLIVIGRGRIIADTSMSGFIAAASSNHVRVVSPHATSLRNLLVDDGVSITSLEPGVLDIEGVPAARIGDVAAEHGLTLHELTTVEASLEQAFMELTRDSLEFHGGSATTTSETDRKAA